MKAVKKDDMVTWPNTIFSVTDGANVKFRDLTLDLGGNRSSRNLIRLEGSDGSRGVDIRGMRFIDSCPPSNSMCPAAVSQDNSAISFTSSSHRDVNIENNVVDGYMQLTGGGGHTFARIIVARNRIVNPKANGIAMSQNASASSQSYFEDISIVDNSIEDGTGSSIFIGPDGGTCSGCTNLRMRNVLIRGNRISRRSSTVSNTIVGIQVKTPSTGGERLVITDNAITDFDNGSQRHVFGVTVGTDTASAWMDGAVISNNSIAKTHTGMALSNVRGMSVGGNSLIDAGTGISLSVFEDVSISNNIVRTPWIGVVVRAGDRVDIKGNSIHGANNGTNWTAAILLQPQTSGSYANLTGCIVQGNRLTGGGSNAAAIGHFEDSSHTIDLTAVENDGRGNGGGWCWGYGCNAIEVERSNLQ